MFKLSGKKRLFIFLSCVWILFVAIEAIEESTPFIFQWGDFLSIGIFPVIIIWGIYWVISGFKRDKSKSNPSYTTAQNEKPKFQNQEEYEKWKAEKIKANISEQKIESYDSKMHQGKQEEVCSLTKQKCEYYDPDDDYCYYGAEGIKYFKENKCPQSL